MVAPAIAAAARLIGKKLIPKLAKTASAKRIATVAAPALAKIGIKTGRSKTIVADAARKYYQGSSKGASIAAGSQIARLGSKVVPKSLTGKIIVGATVAPIAKDLYGKLGTSSKAQSGMSPALAERGDIFGGYTEVGGVEGGALGAMPTVGSAARIGALPQIQGLLRDPKVQGALVAAGVIAAGAEALGIIDIIPGVGKAKKAKAKAKAKKKTTVGKRKTAAKRAAGATFKALAKKWKKLSPAAKARYEGMFSEYIKVHREKAISAKSRPKPKKRTTQKRTTKKRTTQKRTVGKRKMSSGMKKQQAKMRAAAKKWKSYKGRMSYQAFMSKALRS